jgi:hypothetical protein
LLKDEHDEAAMRGRPKAELVLSETERDQLTSLTMRRKTAQALALRARIVQACAGASTTGRSQRNCGLLSKLSRSGERAF